MPINSNYMSNIDFSFKNAHCRLGNVAFHKNVGDGGVLHIVLDSKFYHSSSVLVIQYCNNYLALLNDTLFLSKSAVVLFLDYTQSHMKGFKKCVIRYINLYTTGDCGLNSRVQRV